MKAQDEFCPNIQIKYWMDNMRYVIAIPDSELSKEKSREMLKLLLYNSRRFEGYIMHAISKNPQRTKEKSNFISQIENKEWIYRTDGKLGSIHMDIAYLDWDIYNNLDFPENAFENIGFVITKPEMQDEHGEIDIEKAMAVFLENADDKEIQKLARIFLSRIPESRIGAMIQELSGSHSQEDSNEDVFDPTSYTDSSFPEVRVHNIEKLRNEIIREFYEAEPVRYEKVYRSIRVSKDYARELIKSEYTNESGVTVCQICRKQTENAEVVELFNTGREIPEMHLCLCPECAEVYRKQKKNNKNLKNEWIAAIQEECLEDPDGGYPVKISENATVYFTNHHLKEIETIMGLLDYKG
jgi:hypothetical protein